MDSAHRKPGYMLIYAYRYDEFGTKQKYCFALADGYLGEGQIGGMKIAASHSNAQLIVIGETSEELPQIEWLRFINLFGGPVFSGVPIEPAFTDQLVTLAFNKLPDGLQGAPDDLFEGYVQAGLEFIFAGRVIRYGQERRFEARPDGLVMPNPHFTALYDTKAYSKGYEITLDTLRQFSSYVKDFQRRYGQYRQRLNAFIVVSGAYPHRSSTLAGRSREMLADCGVPLAFLTAQDLAATVEKLREIPVLRRSINWARIFSEPIVKPKQVQTEIDNLLKDRVAPPGKE